MRKYSGKPIYEKLFEREVFACGVKDLILSYSEVRRERECEYARLVKVYEKLCCFVKNGVKKL